MYMCIALDHFQSAVTYMILFDLPYRPVRKTRQQLLQMKSSRFREVTQLVGDNSVAQAFLDVSPMPCYTLRN